MGSEDKQKREAVEGAGSECQSTLEMLLWRRWKRWKRVEKPRFYADLA